MGHDVFGLVVEHQVDSRKGCVTKECCRQAAEESPVPLSAIDAPQGCIDALIAILPTLQGSTGPVAGGSSPGFEQRTHLTSGYMTTPGTTGPGPTWLLFSGHSGLDFRFQIWS